MTFRIPSQDRRVSQPNNSDVNGNIYATRNIDFDEEGYIKLSAGSVSLYSQDDDADFDNVMSMFHGSNVHMLGGEVFRISTVDLDFGVTNATATDTTPPSPGPEEDGAFFNDTEVVSDGSNVKYNNGGTWTNISGTQSPTIGESSVMEVFPAQNALLFGTGNKVNKIGSGWTVLQTLTIPADYMVTSIATNGNYAYIGTRHQENGEAMMFIWNGANTTNDGSYGVGTFEISSVKRYGASVAVVTTLGQLLRFNGSGFDELANLPVYYSRFHWGIASNEYGGITNRGMVVDGDLIYLVVNAEVESIDTRHMQNMLGGVWCYDPKVGLYHKYSFSNNTVVKDEGVDTADINTTTNVITVSGITVPQTGTPVYYADGTATIGGLVDSSWYYTIKVTDTTFKLALTKEDADNGTEVSLTSTSTANAFYFVKKNDYGVTVSGDRTASLVLNDTEVETKQLGRIIFSSQINNATGTKKDRIHAVSDMIENRGYFVTPKMFADSVTDVFNSITVRFSPLKYGDKIIVKYRDKERVDMPAVPRSQNSVDNQVTWTSATVFTTPASPNQGYYNFDSVQEGDEVEIIDGSGSGFTAHVSSITKSGYQYTVTLDEANPFVSASDKSTVMINNWTVLDTIDYTYEDTHKTISVDTNSAWCQFKIELQGTNVRISDNVVNNRQYTRPR